MADRFEITARTWAAQERIVEAAHELADRIDVLAEWPDNSAVRYAASLLVDAYRRQDADAWWAALADFLGKLAGLKEAGVPI